jgi:hypothetical protein
MIPWRPQQRGLDRQKTGFGSALRSLSVPSLPRDPWTASNMRVR